MTSSAHGKLVAAITMILFSSLLLVSSSTSSWFVRRWSAIVLSVPLELAMESISSKKIIAGHTFLAHTNKERISFSLPPTHFDVSSAHEALKYDAFISFAVALAIKDLPVPMPVNVE